MFNEEIKNIDCSKPALKKFGITFSIIFLLLGIILYFNNSQLYLYSIITGLLFLSTSIIFPKALIPFYKTWMTLAIILGIITTNIILILLFYLVLTPIGLIIKLSGKELLDLKFDKEKKSYWNKREFSKYKKENSERQY